MTADKQKAFRRLKILYLFIFLLSVILVVPAHLFPLPLFMPLRFPHYLEMMTPFLGISWPMTFEIYHFALYVLIAIGSLNVIGIIFFPKLRKIAIASSLTGLFFISPMVLFFFFVFLRVNASTAITYGIYCTVLLIADFLTFKALIQEQKEA